jgi:hypothetical protein
MVPETYGAAHVVPQLMPAGELVTPPVPAPTTVIPRVNRGAKVAVTELLAPIATVHELVPAQPDPLHPVKADPRSGDAVRVTLVPVL